MHLLVFTYIAILDIFVLKLYIFRAIDLRT
jgi:hypothetical protein